MSHPHASWPTRPPPQRRFFDPLLVESILTPNDIEAIRFAYIVSKHGHAKQVRDDGTRYFDHPKGAAWIYIDELGGRDPRVIIDILLHDISEDAYLLSPRRIMINFGKTIAEDIQALTKLPKGKETTKEYLERITGRGPEAILAKLCDRLHNIRDLGGCSEEKRHGQISETLECHLPILVPALQKHGGEWALHAEAIEKMLVDAIRVWQA